MLSRMDVQTRLANESLPTAKKVAKFLKDIYKSIQALLEGKDPSSREARLMESGMVDIKTVADAWADAIAKASKSQQTELTTGIKLQKRSEYSAKEQAIIDAYIKGVDEKLLRAFTKYREGTYNRRYKVDGPVVDREIGKAIQQITGIDVSGFQLAIDYVGFE